MAIVDRELSGTRQLEERFDEAVLVCIEADVTVEEQVEAYLETTLENFGAVDAFFNNAGIVGTACTDS